MATDPIAWGTDDGLHTPELYRVLAEIASEGEAGVLGLNDCKVVQLAVPGAGVNVNPGVSIIPCRLPGLTYQKYVARIPTQDTAGVTATGAGSGRTDLVVHVVDAPPANPSTFVRVLSNVGAGGTLPAPVTNRATAIAYLAAQGLSAEPLALIVLPVSTATVTTGMLTDLRAVARPRSRRGQYANASGGVVQLTSATFVDWAVSQNVDVPSWATSVIVRASVRARIDRSTTTVNGTALGNLRVRLGGTAVAPVAVSQSVAYDEFAPFADGTTRVTQEVADTFAVPASLRGQNAVPLALQGLKSSGTKNLYTDTASFVQLSWEFVESAA